MGPGAVEVRDMANATKIHTALGAYTVDMGASVDYARQLERTGNTLAARPARERRVSVIRRRCSGVKALYVAALVEWAAALPQDGAEALAIAEERARIRTERGRTRRK